MAIRGGGGGGGKHTLTITKPTNGNITSEPDGIDCESKTDTCQAEFEKDTEVTLTAEADTGYAPGAWGDACASVTEAGASCTVKMDTDKTVSKVFSETGDTPETPVATKYTLTITEPTGGNITSDVGDINCGSKGNACRAQFDKVVEVTLTAKADTGYVLGAWQGACDKTDADQPCKLVMDTDMAAGLTLAIDPNDIDGDGEPNETDVDDDNDGLIEIHNLDMFNHIRYNLAGTAYKAGSSATASIIGAPTGSPTANCKTATDGVYLCGYELMRDLDFNEDSSYATGSTNKSVWQPDNSNPDRASNAGFEGIEDGFGEEGFPSIFEGNGYTISNLYSRNTNSMSPGDGEDGKPRARVGLFKSIEANATIRNLGVVDARLYGSAFGNEQIGSLVSKNKGNILACHATGKANGGDGVDYIGGLVGANTTGAIIDSHATVVVDGGNAKDRVGGLVGYNNKGSIRNSHATGAVNGDDGNDRVGGLVGRNKGNISLSYATGAVTGSTGNKQDIGGLVGWNDKDGRITASYATGVVRDDGTNGSIGGLVGYNKGSIVASHVTGGTITIWNIGNVGGLVGSNHGSISASYVTGGTIRGYHVGGLVGENHGSISASYVTGGTIRVTLSVVWWARTMGAFVPAMPQGLLMALPGIMIVSVVWWALTVAALVPAMPRGMSMVVLEILTVSAVW